MIDNSCNGNAVQATDYRRSAGKRTSMMNGRTFIAFMSASELSSSCEVPLRIYEYVVSLDMLRAGLLLHSR